ncbi:NADH-quinone oxidoreductase subunit L [candidate division KSB1 bacterium]|nr:NADH-quinone oxidoreductase subunit L [candidate division KSB1 bacterium]NIR68398.1 NADH-quinone oxidoreductase subunit L [candidate division KSB1 bacterium]NIS22472.1 NADH-quinone oxidoreductase subunit L [candidate division KSB1 bacterium]NIT69320.1 NADH-quinone oxidoreductase subunit L [candidate division KSB1 bacterium]NIU22977.1 NADH-quinone oxidoreductase subunit L [candidate division KSB1 bacterium]
MTEYVWLVPFFPLLGFLINGLFGTRFKEKLIGTIACTAVGLSFVASAWIFLNVLSLPEEVRSLSRIAYTWIAAGEFEVNIGFLIDPLSLVMMLVVSGVGLLIHVYSIGYMAGDRGYARYFAFLNLFTFAMLILVMADNFLLMFVGWEGVGLCSYLLIGFWFEEDYNAFAGRKAFVVNRIGDFGFLLGIFFIFFVFGTLNFEAVFSQAPQLDTGMATTIALLLFVGAVGKSAQIPLYVWLPDAMAGPTPVSALIHAATMVTAGVYMVARCHMLYLQSPTAMTVVAVIGLATAFLAATIALVNTDIKRVLAYSTISQLGYMFLACGVGAFGAGVFHVSTHAYFKALLFLSAGSVMHALSNETDMTKMGALRKKLPVTYKVFLVGALALAGVPFFSGFFSKDEILWKTVSNTQLGGFKFWFVGALVAGLTAFYIFRLIYLTFHGHSRVPKDVESHIHESPKIMTVPLRILAFLSIVGGFVGIPHVFNKFEHFLEPVFPSTTHPDLLNLEIIFMVISTLIALMGIGFAYLFYVAKPSMPYNLAKKMSRVYRFLNQKWYVDELYDVLVVRPFNLVSEVVFWRWIDMNTIDGFINRLADMTRNFSDRLRRIETGIVQNYALSIVFGIVVLIGYFLFK